MDSDKEEDGENNVEIPNLPSSEDSNDEGWEKVPLRKDKRRRLSSSSNVSSPDHLNPPSKQPKAGPSYGSDSSRENTPARTNRRKMKKKQLKSAVVKNLSTDRPIQQPASLMEQPEGSPSPQDVVEQLVSPGKSSSESGGPHPSEDSPHLQANEDQPSNPPPSVNTNNSPSAALREGTNQSWSKIASRQPRAPPKSLNTPKSDPVFCRYPVILTDTMEPGPVRLKALEWKLADLLETDIGPVLHIRSLGGPQTLVGCASSYQQQKLMAKKSIGQLKVRTHIPVPKVQGVVKGIPCHVPEKDILARISDSRVTQVHRLSTQEGKPSTAVRVTLETAILPDSITINKREWDLHPYVAGVQRCYRCNKLGHIKKNCPAKKETCTTCASPNHKADKCDSPKRHCINCKGDHSAAYGGCPARKTWLAANRLRAQAYIPMAQAWRQAKQLVKPPSNPQLPTENQPLAHGWRQLDQLPPSPVEISSDLKVQNFKPIPRPRSRKVNLTSSSGDSVESEEVHALKRENGALRSEIVKLNTTIQSLSNSLADLKNEITQLRKAQAEQNKPKPLARANTQGLSDKTIQAFALLQDYIQTILDNGGQI